jgi:hypothetical protein
VQQNKLTRLVNKLAAGDLSILVFIKVAEVRIGEGASGSMDCCEFGGIEMPVAVAIGQGRNKDRSISEISRYNPGITNSNSEPARKPQR